MVIESRLHASLAAAFRRLVFGSIAASVALVCQSTLVSAQPATIEFQAAPTHAEKPRPAKPSSTMGDPVRLAWSHQADVVGCADCHYAGPRENPLVPQPQLGSFSRQVEMQIWLERDIHALARQRIEPLRAPEVEAHAKRLRSQYGFDDKSINAWVGETNIRSREMCDALGYDVDTLTGYGQFRDHCLTCHGGYEFGTDPTGFERTGQQQAGLDCNHCHQVADEDAWVDAHRKPTSWRLLDPIAKSQQGMRDLVSMSAQAALCADCHIGNLVQHRFVTHAMYAAGHPPLPPFELQTFCAQMPRHWRTPDELYASLAASSDQLPYFRTNYTELVSESQADPDWSAIAWGIRQMMTGAIQSRRHWLQLLADASQSETWGDYALYDCAACHHELRTDSLRQQRGYPGTPGRPREAEWSQVLHDLVVATMAANSSASEFQIELDRAFDAQPFGDAKRVGQAAASGMQQLDSFQRRLAAESLNANFVRRALDQLLLRLDRGMSNDGQIPEGGSIRSDSDALELLDENSAHQIISALRVMSNELSRLNAPLPAAAQSLIFRLGASSFPHDPLPPDAQATVEQFEDTDSPSEELVDVPRRRAEYEPDVLAAELLRLRAILAE